MEILDGRVMPKIFVDLSFEIPSVLCIWGVAKVDARTLGMADGRLEREVGVTLEGVEQLDEVAASKGLAPGSPGAEEVCDVVGGQRREAGDGVDKGEHPVAVSVR